MEKTVEIEGESSERKQHSKEIFFRGICPHKLNRFDNYFSSGYSCFSCWNSLYDPYISYAYGKILISILNNYKVKIIENNYKFSLENSRNYTKTNLGTAHNRSYSSFIDLLYNNSTGYLDPYI